MSHLPMHAFWQGSDRNVGRSRREQRRESISADDGRVALLKDLSGGSMSTKACRKLLVEHGGDVDAAGDAFIQLTGSDGMIEKLNEEAEEDDEDGAPESLSVADVLIPAEAASMPGVLEWMQMQLAATGTTAKLSFNPSKSSSKPAPSPPTHDSTSLTPSADPGSASNRSPVLSDSSVLSCSETEVQSLPGARQVAVQFSKDLVNSIVKRDRGEMSSSGGEGADIRFAPCLFEMSTAMARDGVVHPQKPWVAGKPARPAAGQTAAQASSQAMLSMLNPLLALPRVGLGGAEADESAGDQDMADDAVAPASNGGGCREVTQASLKAAARHQYDVFVGDVVWVVPAAVLEVKPDASPRAAAFALQQQHPAPSSPAKQPAGAAVSVSVKLDGGPAPPHRDAAAKAAAKAAASKITSFVRYGGLPAGGVRPFVEYLEKSYPDTRIFYEEGPARGWTTFVACGIASRLAAQYLSGTVVFDVPCPPLLTPNSDSLVSLRALVFKQTGCFFFLKAAAGAEPDTSAVGVLGPASARRQAVDVISGHRYVTECVLRIPPEYNEVFRAKGALLSSRLGCRVRSQGSGRVRLVGRSEALVVAKDVVGKLCAFITTALQGISMTAVTRSLMADVLHVETRVLIPPGIKPLLQGTGFTAARGDLPGKQAPEGPLFKRNVEDLQRKATTLWAGSDSFTDTLGRLLQQEKIVTSVEDMGVGSLMMDLHPGDVVERGVGWNMARTGDSRTAGKTIRDLVIGKPAPLQHFVTGKVIRVEPGIQEGGHSFQLTVLDWIRCTLDPMKPDPGRPTCDALTLSWDTEEGKTARHVVACPGALMLRRVERARRSTRNAKDAALIAACKDVLRMSYASTVDEVLFSELLKVVKTFDSGDRQQIVALERCRQRARESAREAHQLTAATLKALYAIDCESPGKAKGKPVKDALLHHVDVISHTWTQMCKLAEWEVEAILHKGRALLDEASRAENWTQTCWEAVQRIATSTGAYVDYSAPQDYFVVSGNEDNVRQAVKALNQLPHAGLVDREPACATVRLTPEESDALADNHNFLLNLVAQESRVLSATTDGLDLVLKGTAKQVNHALGLVKRPGQRLETEGDKEAAVCKACLLEEFSDDEEGRKFVELLCGHRLHPGCVARYAEAVCEQNSAVGCSSAAPCSCPVRTCAHILTPNEYSDLVDMVAPAAHPKLPTPLQNLSAIVQQALISLDRIVPCPTCKKWVVTGGTTAPVSCLHCGHTFCGQTNPICGGVAHYFSTCHQYLKAKRETAIRMGATVTESELTPPVLPDNIVVCAKCPAWIIREEEKDGEKCRYMKCRQCSYEFCWQCLLPSIDHRHVNLKDLSEAVECDPSRRNERREKLTKAHEVSLWRGFVTCDRCGTHPGGRDGMYGCLECLNQYLCKNCVGKGCTANPTHAIGALPLEDPPTSLSQRPNATCPAGHPLQQHGPGLKSHGKCNICNSIGDASNYYGCRLCDYDLCKQCTAQALEKPVNSDVASIEIPEEFWTRVGETHKLPEPSELPDEDEDSNASEERSVKKKTQFSDFITGSLMTAAYPSSASGLVAAMLALQ
ncbi:hypothetical protein DIPPA_00665 [Diplonema papillatum]|nr:hypothetical protein DIPPA_00665 [Diplonema papillatum]